MTIKLVSAFTIAQAVAGSGTNRVQIRTFEKVATGRESMNAYCTKSSETTLSPGDVAALLIAAL